MQFPVKPIAYKRAHEQISEQLLELLRSGKRNPGSNCRLNETCARFSTSAGRRCARR